LEWAVGVTPLSGNQVSADCRCRCRCIQGNTRRAPPQFATTATHGPPVTLPPPRASTHSAITQLRVRFVSGWVGGRRVNSFVNSACTLLLLLPPAVSSYYTHLPPSVPAGSAGTNACGAGAAGAGAPPPAAAGRGSFGTPGWPTTHPAASTKAAAIRWLTRIFFETFRGSGGRASLLLVGNRVTLVWE